MKLYVLNSGRENDIYGVQKTNEWQKTPKLLDKESSENIWAHFCEM